LLKNLMIVFSKVNLLVEDGGRGGGAGGGGD
jgi:hypothetical protein